MYGISTSMYFLIIVIQLVGCGGSNPKTGVMVNGRSRRKRVGSQCSTVLSGEISIISIIRWDRTGRRILLDQSNFDGLPGGGGGTVATVAKGRLVSLHTAGEWINQLTHSKSWLQIPMNYPESRPHHDDVWRRRRWSWGASWTGWASPTTLRFSEKGWFFTNFSSYLHKSIFPPRLLRELGRRKQVGLMTTKIWC